MINSFISLLLAASSTVCANDLDYRQETIPAKYFEVFRDSTLSSDEYYALQFLYSYMPLPDLAGYPEDFHLTNVRSSLRAREEMPWGKSVPQREFLHFVLPVRVNNEALDLSRPQFYEELKERVKNLSMKDAILEVNHWCHEHVTYKPSDGRTSPPLSTMSQAIGRCGEESTFTVAALRAVGIPARQVYTTRWAHTDSNHAWVEAWADGEWYFLGACEPAPVLNMAWFNDPASRGVLMTTTVFGRYDGPEEKIITDPLSTTINVTSNYAPVNQLDVKIVDREGNPVKDAKVAFSVYNYAELYPVATKKSDLNGLVSLTAGLGDFMVWATDGENFGFSKGNPKDSGVLTIALDKDKNYKGSFDVDLVPPSGNGLLPIPSEEMIKENERRLSFEDSIRKAYESTFVSENEVRRLAESLNIKDYNFVNMIRNARGNSTAICNLIGTLSPQQRDKAIALLGAVTEKDTRDIPSSVIIDCINHSDGPLDDPLFVNYVLSPRIDNEHLVPFKKAIFDALGQEKLIGFREKPEELREWINSNIKVETLNNPNLLYYDPITVLNTRTADPDSRDIFFVAVARTAGIPSRIDPVTFKVQIIPEGASDWVDIRFEPTEDSDKNIAKGYLSMLYEQVGRNVNPAYYTHFSISKISDGLPIQLEFADEDGWKEISERNEPFDAGQYLLLTGQRLADGTVLSHGEIFTINAGETTECPLIIREDTSAVKVIGSLDSENKYLPVGEKTEQSLLSKAGRGYYVLGIIQPGHEPSAHALNDISAVRKELEKTDREIIVLFPDKDSAGRFDISHFSSLPSNLSFGIDTDGVILEELKESLNLTSSDLPIFVIADSFNRIVFLTQGYSIGLGERLLDTLSKIL